jgi:hypothetical protein
MPLMLAAAASAAACDSGPERGAGRGTAGRPRGEDIHRPAEWSLSAEPVVDIGGDGQGALFMVTSAVRAGDGFVVANSGTGELRWYDGSGKFSRSAGRKGAGPGEFAHLGWVGVLPGDSIAAWDPVLRRLSIFTVDGRFSRAVTVSGAGPLTSVAGVLHDGTLLLSSRARGEPPPDVTVWRDTVLLLRLRLGDGRTDTIGRFPGTEWYGGANARVQAVPLGRQTSMAVAGNRIYVGTGERYEIGVYGADGALHERFGRPQAPVRLTGEDRAAFLRDVIHVGGTERDRQERARSLAEAPFPETLPPYTSLLADAEGNVWVREPQRPTHTPPIARWSVFDPRGRWIATVDGPARFKALQIGADWMLGTLADSVDAEHALVYRIRKR